MLCVSAQGQLPSTIRREETMYFVHLIQQLSIQYFLKKLAQPVANLINILRSRVVPDWKIPHITTLEA